MTQLETCPKRRFTRWTTHAGLAPAPITSPRQLGRDDWLVRHGMLCYVAKEHLGLPTDDVKTVSSPTILRHAAHLAEGHPGAYRDNALSKSRSNSAGKKGQPLARPEVAREYPLTPRRREARALLFNVSHTSAQKSPDVRNTPRRTGEEKLARAWNESKAESL